MRLLLAGLALALAAPAFAKEPATVRVRLTTSAGAITLALDTRHAPATTANFLAYVDDGRFDGLNFYRATRIKAAPQYGFIQGGIRTDALRILPPFPLETTRQTGILHLDGTISMARRADPSSAGGNFFITIGALPSMDWTPESKGYSAFGRVVGGMDVVKRILAMPTGGGSDAFKGQMLLKPVKLISARRLDGTPQPTAYPRLWLGAGKVKGLPPGVLPSATPPRPR